MSDHASSTQAGEGATDAGGSLVQIADILRSYLSTDSTFTPEMAVEQVRAVINSKAGMDAFVQEALHPGAARAESLVVSLAKVLDDHGPSPEETVLQLIEIVESPAAVEVYERETESRNPTGEDGPH